MENDFSDLFEIAETLKETSFPRQFSPEITAFCNYRCSMCYHDSMHRTKGEMSFELFKRCADQIAEASLDTEDFGFPFTANRFLSTTVSLKCLHTQNRWESVR